MSEAAESLLSPEQQFDQALAPEDMNSELHNAQEVEQPVQDEAKFEWGDRPDYIPEQFWDPENGPMVEQLAKSYQELRTKMSTGKHKAPKDGAYSIEALKDFGVEADDPLLSQFTEFAKENGLSQEQYDTLSTMYAQQMSEFFAQEEASLQEEMEKLGPKADKIVGGLNQWLTKMSMAGTLSHDELDSITRAANNANFINALNKIRGSYGEKVIPDASIAEGKSMSRSDLDALVADERYGKDMHYTQSVERKFMEFFGEA